MIEVLLVDDHPSVMEGTRVILEQEGDIKVSFAHSAAMAMEIVNRQSFNVILIDLQMPDINGIDLAKKVLGKTPDATILIYTGHEFKHHFNLMIEAGVSGFVQKTAGREQLVTAIRCAIRGEAVLPLALMKQLRRLSIPIPSEQSDEDGLAITDKEQRILQEIAKGRSNEEIASVMLMSQRSLEYCLTHLFHKLKVKSRVEAVMKAKHLELLDVSEFPRDA